MNPDLAEFKQHCRANGVSERHMRKLIADGRVRAVRPNGKTVCIVLASWREYLQKLIAEPMPEYTGTKAAVESRDPRARQAGRDDELLDELGLLK